MEKKYGFLLQSYQTDISHGVLNSIIVAQVIESSVFLCLVCEGPC